MTTSQGSGGVIVPEDIAIMWTEERRRVEGANAPEVPVDWVYDFYRWSKPTPAGNKRRNRYEEYPMPYGQASRGQKRPAWHIDQEPDIRAFWHQRYAKNRTEEAIKAGKRRAAEWRRVLDSSKSKS